MNNMLKSLFKNKSQETAVKPIFSQIVIINPQEASTFPHTGLWNIFIMFFIQLFIKILWDGSWSYDLILNNRILKQHNAIIFEFKCLNCTLTFGFHFTKIPIFICLIQISHIIYVSLYLIICYFSWRS